MIVGFVGDLVDGFFICKNFCSFGMVLEANLGATIEFVGERNVLFGLMSVEFEDVLGWLLRSAADLTFIKC